MLVYIYRNTVNQKVYVGKTAFALRKRHLEHLAMVRYGDNSYFHNALRKNGPEIFEVCVVTFARSDEEASELEKMFIERYRATDPKYGYNLTAGGDGLIPSEVTRGKLRAARIGKPSPAKGKRWSAESKQRASESHTGVKRGACSETTKDKIRAAKLKSSIRHEGKKHEVISQNERDGMVHHRRDHTGHRRSSSSHRKNASKM
jgi:group I intron endonuclease